MKFSIRPALGVFILQSMQHCLGDTTMSREAEVVTKLLANPTDQQNVYGLVAPNATYISLCFSNENLKKLMSYAGIHKNEGPEAILSTFERVNAIWKTEDFSIEHIFSQGKNVAAFGRFTFRAIVTGKSYTSPFSIRAEVMDGQVVFMQFMEDTFGTASTFAQNGEVTYEMDAGQPVEITY